MITRVSGRDSMISRHASTPSFFGNHDVHDDHVGRQLGGRLNRLHPVPGLAHHLELLGPLQNHLKTFPRDRMVVGEQHPYATRLR